MTQVLSLEQLKLVAGPTSTQRSSRVCRHFARGRCTWGASCRFSHDVERLAEESCSPSPPPSLSIAQPGVPNSQSLLWIGEQQQQLQKQRHAILQAALNREFGLQSFVGADSQTQYYVHLTQLPSPRILVNVLGTEQLREHLLQLDRDERIRDGGLHYLIGEPTAFWSMIKHYHARGTTTHQKWDTLIFRAKAGQVGCMFFHSAVGCLSPNCAFAHVSREVTPLPGAAPLLSMATSNTVLGQVPSLGFGSARSQTDLTVGDTKSPIAPCEPSPVSKADPLWNPTSSSTSAASQSEIDVLPSVVWSIISMATESGTAPSIW